MKNNLPVYELKINDSLADDSEVSYVALVDAPAIQKDFLIFQNDGQFINPTKGEHQTDFIDRCVKYVIDEGKDAPQAVAICNSLWDSHFANYKISFDYDGTLSTKRGKELALRLIKEGNTVYIVSARSDVNGMTEVASQLGIPGSRIYATGSNKAKVEKIKELGIYRHYDNNPDVISELGSVGVKFIMNHKFSITNEEQRIISGALMLADELIYRNSPEFGEHYVKFTADTIKQIVIKFAKRQYQNNVNLMHNNNLKVDGVTMIESFITDKNRGIQPIKGFEDVADGSWFGSYYVENDDVWNMIKHGDFKGFSVEGLFEMVEAKAFINNEDDEVFEILSQINNIINKNKKK